MFHDDEPLSAMEQDTESLISMMQEIQRVRASINDPVTGAQISDDERRKRAAEMIEKISKMMDLGEDDDDDDGENDDDEWENLKNGISKSVPKE